MKIMQYLRDWTLIIAILAGIIGYFLYVNIPWLDSTHGWMLSLVETLQPLLIFAMLFLTFCHIDIHDIRPCRWHIWLILVQSVSFIALGIVLILIPQSAMRVILEGAMICLICPTATAAAVITRKLGGDMAHITTYTILINLVASILIPVMVPFVHPASAMAVEDAMLLIMGKVFPLLLLPLVLGMLVRKLLPGFHKWVTRWPDLSFYLWALALTLAIAVTVRSMMHSTVSAAGQWGLVAVSLITCALQFAIGRKIGRRYHDTITAGQALGQKNTVFAIWLGYTFFSPVTSMVGGFYSIWHNLVNSWQLYKHEQRERHEKSGKLATIKK